MIGIVVALPEELKTLTPRRLRRGEVIKIRENVMVALAGVGANNAKAAAEQLLLRKVDYLMSWGCAAGLNQGLKPGDLILAYECVAMDGKRIGASSSWAQQVSQELADKMAVNRGQLAESQAIISSASEKAELGRATGAIALDMESAAVARVAFSKGVSFLGVRAVADPLDFSLPDAVNHAVDNGQVNRLKLATFLLVHPWQIPALIKLGLCFHTAKKSLQHVAQHLDNLGYSETLETQPT